MRTRFAPSPTGYLHLGHAYSAKFTYELAQKSGGAFLVRIEDIDFNRSKADYESQIFKDLAWLGLSWEPDVLRQSTRQNAYNEALEQLRDAGLLYPCECTRKDIENALQAPQEGSGLGPDGPIYPQTCKSKKMLQSQSVAWRLNMDLAVQKLPKDMSYWNNGQKVTFAAKDLPDTVGDIVLARRDIKCSYHIAVVVDDAYQDITDVSRGLDMEAATPIHVTLQHLLNLEVPNYHHHPLIRDEQGKRLAKRDDALAIKTLREQGMSAQDVLGLVGY